MMTRCLRSSEAEPTLLSGWLLRLLLDIWRSTLSRLSRCRRTAGIPNIIPSHIQEDRLHGDQGHLGRELNHIVQIHASGGVVTQALDERGLASRGSVGSFFFTDVVDVDDGAVALELAVEEVVEEEDVFGGDVDVEGAGGVGRGGGELGGGLFAEA